MVSLVPEEKYLTLEGFHKFAVDRAKQDIRSVWRAILACGYDLHFERWDLNSLVWKHTHTLTHTQQT